jgi:hypothetical protein
MSIEVFSSAGQVNACSHRDDMVGIEVVGEHSALVLMEWV